MFWQVRIVSLKFKMFKEKEKWAVDSDFSRTWQLLGIFFCYKRQILLILWTFPKL